MCRGAFWSGALSLYDHMTGGGTEGWSSTALGASTCPTASSSEGEKTRKGEALLLAQAEADNPSIVCVNGDTELSEESMPGDLQVNLLWKSDDQQCGTRSCKATNGQPQT